MSRNLKVALTAVGSRGDVQPIVALGQALRQRGHMVRIGAPPDFGDWITAQGFDFVPVGSDIRRYLSDNPDLFTGSPRQSLKAAERFFWQEVPAHVRDMTPLCEWSDLIAWGGLAVVALPVAQHLRRPALGIMYSSCMLPSGLHPPPNIPWHGLPAWFNRLFWWINRLASNRIAGRPINQVRAGMGMPPVNFRDYMLKEGRTVVATDAALFPHDPGWAATVKPANFIHYDDPQPLDAELQDWLDDGEPPVFVGFGSMSGHNTQRVEQLVREAMGQIGRRCLIGAGWAGLGSGELPTGWRMVREVPHAKLFPRVAAVVHHGGSGTTANALRAGVPQLILPLILDQYYHAHRLYLAGLMPKPVSMETINAQQLADGIRSVISQSGLPLRQIARRLQDSDGRTIIARELESMAAA